MLVKFISNNSKIYVEAQKIAETADDGFFSARDISRKLDIDVDRILGELKKLEETNYVLRVLREGDEWTPPIAPETRWARLRLSFLTLGKVYEVIGIENDAYHIVGDFCEPVLFNSSGFQIVDATEPEIWEWEEDEDGSRCCCIPQWNKPGFWEDYDDGVEEARKQFNQDLKEHYPYTWHQMKDQKRDNIRELIHLLEEVKEGFLSRYDDDGAAAFVGIGQAIDSIYDRHIELLKNGDLSQIKDLRILTTQFMLLRTMSLSKGWDNIFDLIESNY
jgi:hypothetical protein